MLTLSSLLNFHSFFSVVVVAFVIILMAKREAFLERKLIALVAEIKGENVDIALWLNLLLPFKMTNFVDESN